MAPRASETLGAEAGEIEAGTFKILTLPPLFKFAIKFSQVST